MDIIVVRDAYNEWLETKNCGCYKGEEKNMYTPKEIVEMVKGVLITIVVIILLYAVLRGTASALPSREMMVVDCFPVENYWEVVVEDANGNQWSYFADHYTENGVISVQMDGDEIVAVK